MNDLQVFTFIICAVGVMVLAASVLLTLANHHARLAELRLVEGLVARHRQYAADTEQVQPTIDIEV